MAKSEHFQFLLILLIATEQTEQPTAFYSKACMKEMYGTVGWVGLEAFFILRLRSHLYAKYYAMSFYPIQ